MKYRNKKILFNIIGAILALLIILMVFFAATMTTLNIVYIKTNVVGYSMLPTLNTHVTEEESEGDVIYINRFKDVKLNDIVVAQWNDKYIIKRLVGLPGDKIEIIETENGYKLLVNDNVLYIKEKHEEDFKSNIGSTNYYFNTTYQTFLNNYENQHLIKEKADGTKYILLGENDYFLIGDNWGRTTDSLSLGSFKREMIIGKVDLIVPYGEEESDYIFKFINKIIFN